MRRPSTWLERLDWTMRGLILEWPLCLVAECAWEGRERWVEGLRWEGWSAEECEPLGPSWLISPMPPTVSAIANLFVATWPALRSAEADATRLAPMPGSRRALSADARPGEPTPSNRAGLA